MTTMIKQSGIVALTFEPFGGYDCMTAAYHLGISGRVVAVFDYESWACSASREREPEIEALALVCFDALVADLER